MPISHSRGTRAPFWLPLLALIALAGPARSEEALSDSTITDRWTLSNGLTVVTRHIPRLTRVSMTLSYGSGTSQDPPGREGIARLLAEVAYLGAASDVPERSREEMSSLRPQGWNLKVAPFFTQLTEISSHATFPGVLHQVAARAHGVTLSEPLLATAIAAVKRDLAEQYADKPELALYHQVRGLAEGALPQRMARYASGAGLDRLPPDELNNLLALRYMPSNAVLAIAGNLGDYDVRRMVESQFGDIPGGTRESPVIRRLQPGVRILPLRSVVKSAGVVAILAPTLTDSLHGDFCINSLLLGSFFRNQWGPPEAPLTTRFEYSIVDEPDLVRLYVPMERSTSDSARVADDLIYTMSELPMENAGPDAYRDVIDHVDWLLGGALPPGLLRRLKSDPGTLYTLSTNMAAREYWGGPEFWALYRERLRLAADLGFASWPRYYMTPDNQAEVRVTPLKR